MDTAVADSLLSLESSTLGDGLDLTKGLFRSVDVTVILERIKKVGLSASMKVYICM